MREFSNQQNRGSIWTVFATFALVCTALFFIPAFVIRPFSYQAPRALVVAMAIRHHAPWPTLIAALICLGLALSLWRGANWWRRTVLVAVMVIVTFSATMARINYFEWMFHPVASPGFEAEGQSKLDAKEMVLAIRFGGDARAYPIREMAYHHIVNDVVGGVPVAVTY
jgi:hypothetical protein